MNQDIRQFCGKYNYTSQSESRLKCEASLKHSLRITSTLPDSQAKAKPTKKLEWNEALSANNLIWCNGKLSQLDTWSEETRMELLYRIAPVPRIHNQKKLQTQHRQYQLKMKKAITSELNKENNEAAEFLQAVLDTDGHVSYSKIERFGRLNDAAEESSGLKCWRPILNAHNQVHRRAPTNAVYLQEGIFKVPHQWQVDSDTVSLKEYIELNAQIPGLPFSTVPYRSDYRSQ